MTQSAACPVTTRTRWARWLIAGDLLAGVGDYELTAGCLRGEDVLAFDVAGVDHDVASAHQFVEDLTRPGSGAHPEGEVGVRRIGEAVDSAVLDASVGGVPRLGVGPPQYALPGLALAGGRPEHHLVLRAAILWGVEPYPHGRALPPNMRGLPCASSVGFLRGGIGVPPRLEP